MSRDFFIYEIKREENVNKHVSILSVVNAGGGCGLIPPPEIYYC